MNPANNIQLVVSCAGPPRVGGDGPSTGSRTHREVPQSAETHPRNEHRTGRRDRAQAGAAHHAADRRQRARKEIAARQRVAHADRALARRGQPGAAHRVRRVRAAGRRAGAKSKPSSKTTTEPPTRARRDGAGAKHVDESGIGLRQVAAVARRLTPETDFTTDEHRRNVFLTDRGVDRGKASGAQSGDAGSRDRRAMCGGPRSTPVRLRESQTTLDAPVERNVSRGLSSPSRLCERPCQVGDDLVQ